MKHVALYTDLAFCLVLLPLMIYAFPVERWWGTHPLYFGAFMAWLYATYFAYRYFIVPRLFHRRRQRIQAVVAAAASLAVTYLFSVYEITSPFYHLRQQHPVAVSFPVWGIRMNQQAVWLHYIVVVIFCFAVGMLAEAYRQRMAREEVEYERNRAELALYKAQINPHFLFNTLNTLYGLLITHSDKTETAMERFIDLMKYAYNNADRDYIPLAEEVDYIGQYIDLQRLRLNDFADVRFTHCVEDGAMPVPPMMLITFVENAFKYGISSNELCFVHITLSQQADALCFEVENSMFRRGASHSQGTGIENCRRRLSLLYPGCHRLSVKQGNSGGIFRVRLELENNRSTC